MPPPRRPSTWFHIQEPRFKRMRVEYSKEGKGYIIGAVIAGGREIEGTATLVVLRWRHEDDIHTWVTMGHVPSGDVELDTTECMKQTFSQRGGSRNRFAIVVRQPCLATTSVQRGPSILSHEPANARPQAQSHCSAGATHEIDPMALNRFSALIPLSVRMCCKSLQ